MLHSPFLFVEQRKLKKEFPSNWSRPFKIRSYPVIVPLLALVIKTLTSLDEFCFRAFGLCAGMAAMAVFSERRVRMVMS